MCPLAAKPGESILPSPQPCSAEGAAPARFGIPVGSGCFSCSYLWGVEDVLALTKKSEVAKNPLKSNTKRCWGDYFLQSPVAVEDKTGWNHFCEQGRPHVGPRCRWILLLNTGVPINQDLESKAFIFFPISTWRRGHRGEEERVRERLSPHPLMRYLGRNLLNQHSQSFWVPLRKTHVGIGYEPKAREKIVWL